MQNIMKCISPKWKHCLPVSSAKMDFDRCAEQNEKAVMGICEKERGYINGIGYKIKFVYQNKKAAFCTYNSKRGCASFI